MSHMQINTTLRYYLGQSNTKYLENMKKKMSKMKKDNVYTHMTKRGT